jgi:hypothetical protein
MLLLYDDDDDEDDDHNSSYIIYESVGDDRNEDSTNDILAL